MRFSDVLGQASALQILQRSLSNEHFAHGQIFVGPEGVGKKNMALAVAQYLNCQHRDLMHTESCGVCPSCIKISYLEHPDVIIIEPDGASIKIEQIRTMNSKVALHAYEGAYKVVIINDAHLMTAQAANSLLKTLEEPTSDTIFILITAVVQQLPATVLSRCQQVQFKPLPAVVLSGILSADYPQKQEELPLVVALCQGSAKIANDLLATDQLTDARKQLYDLLKNFGRQNPSTLILWCEQWDKNRKMVKAILELSQLWFRDCLIWATTKELNLLINQDYASAFDDHLISFGVLTGILQEINEAFAQLECNASPRLVLEVLFLKINKHMQPKMIQQ